MSKRYVLLIGAMKAGTTALFRVLAKHPEIAAATNKEPNTLCNPAAYTQERAAYDALWPDAPQEAWRLEASTSYTKLPAYPSAAVACSRFPGEFRFIYMVRHPVARVRSEYLHSLAEGWIARPVCDHLDPMVVLKSNYRFQLEPYVSMHGREKILVLSYEEFCQDPHGVLARIQAFLGIAEIPPSGRPKRSNDSSQYRSKYLLRLLEKEQVANGIGGTIGTSALQAMECERLVRSLRSQPEAAAILEELQRRIELHTQPSESQIEEMHRLLDRDLELFRADWGIDVWQARTDLPALSLEVPGT